MKRFLAITCILLFLLVSSNAQQGRMLPLSELIDPDGNGWEQITKWKESATNKIEVLPKNNARADSALYRMQLSTSSPVGAMIYSCGGMLIDNGWIRILGSGCEQLDRSLPEWNQGKAFSKYGDNPSFLLIADDVFGGFFAINAGAIDKFDVGKVFYYGPNSLKWRTTGLGYSEFIVFCFSGDIEKFYKGFRWRGWQDEVKQLSGNQVISCYPLLWTDAGKDLNSNRKVVSVQKQWELYQQPKNVTARQGSGKKSSSRKK